MPLRPGSFFNALFQTGTNEAMCALTLLRRSLRGRVLLVNDYYGQLRSGLSRESGISWSLLQDAAQVCSGQGVPPGRREDWKHLYQQAGCR